MNKLFLQVIYIVSLHRYYAMTSDVLTSVKKMEDSLKRLKKGRRTGTVTQGMMSDDDKIRLQITLDIQQFGREVCFHFAEL